MAFGSLPSVLGSGGGTAYSLIGGTGLFADGTAAAPSISFAADTDTGLYRVASGVIGATLNGVSSLRLLRSGSATLVYSGTDNLGLWLFDAGAVSLVAGGTNQNITLTPSGTGGVESAAFRSTASGGYSQFACYNAGSQASAFGYDAGTNRTYLTTNAASSALDVCIGGTAGVGIRILNSGRALLGTTTDSGALLQVGTDTTTLAGGAVFGTAIGVYRAGAGLLAIDHLNGTSPALSFRATGSQTAYLSVPSASVQMRLGTTTAGWSVVFNSGADITALTLDSSQNATFAGDVATANAKAFYWGTRSVMTSPSDGVIRLANSAGTDFTRLQFGGTTATFPSLKRSGNAIQVRFADDSGYTEIEPSGVRLNGVTRIISGVGSPEGATTAPPGSIFLNTSGGASTTLYVKESGAGNTGWVAK